MTTLYHVHNIVWDTSKKLPKAVIIEAFAEDVDDDECFLADCLSDHYGFTIISLQADPIPEEFSNEDLGIYLKMPQLNAKGVEDEKKAN